jgi:agmatinase
MSSRSKESAVKGYAPTDPLKMPRFAGISTFLRLPHVTDLEGVDVAVIGLPFDTTVTFRIGARFGPKGIREGSLALRPDYHPSQRVQVFDHVSVVDYGDSPVVPGFIEPSLELMEESLRPLHEAGVIPIGLGGDHSVLLAELRAAARRHGPLALIQFDSHPDTWDQYFGQRYTHGTVVRRAVEEGLIDPARSAQFGLRGGLYASGDYDEARDMGFSVVPWEDLEEAGTEAITDAVAAAGPAFLTFDIDFVDPAFAPGTGTPEVGGPTSAQALRLLRACRGLEVVAADVVEVAPDLDHAHLTTVLGATVAHEILTLIALRRQAESLAAGGPDHGAPLPGRREI